MGQIYLERNERDPAIASFKEALRLRPEYDEAKVALKKAEGGGGGEPPK